MLNFLGEQFYVNFQYFLQNARPGNMGTGRENLPNDGGIRLAVEPHAIQSVDNANNLTEGSIKRSNPGSTGRNKGSVDIEEQQLHAAILNQGEFYFRLEKHFRGVQVDRKLQSAAFLVANKAHR